MYPSARPSSLRILCDRFDAAAIITVTAAGRQGPEQREGNNDLRPGPPSFYLADIQTDMGGKQCAEKERAHAKSSPSCV